MSMPWTYAGLKRNALGLVISGCFFAMLFALARNDWANDASPIRTVEAIDATVKSAQWGKGSHGTIYVLFLENGSPVLINDDRPHLIDSHVSIERVTRDNGFIFYRFPE
ncbi:hypothetical protein D3227_10135 [Mesorhizobium waimense]|uniref:Uncharacterized protein n=2 Tax=Mesorhizobium waimense TaxID=1300307 RepID=A0A3A5L3I1_9HYPH|nr:hypothetical protein D3227_10135 [Mesorhizobium waimense]